MMPLNYESWLTRIDDSKLIAQLNMPGTHDSLARFTVPREPGLPSLKCQNLDFDEQLQVGVRFFDVRCRRSGDKLPIYHRVAYQQTDFEQILRQSEIFLTKNPSEFIIMNVQEEGIDQDTPPAMQFYDEIKRHFELYAPDRFWPESAGYEFGSVGEVRAKILVVSQTPPVPHCKWISMTSFHVQNTWELEAEQKWSLVLECLESAASASSVLFHLNFISCYKNQRGPKQMADILNPKVMSWIKKGTNIRFGCLLFDYIDDNISSCVVKSNF